MTRDSDDHRALREWIRRIEAAKARNGVTTAFRDLVMRHAPSEAKACLDLRFEDAGE
jgi:hypothetical protein